MTIQWTEKYRPTKLEDYVWRDEAQKRQVEAWIKEGALPTILLEGAAGVGKTSLAKMLLKILNVNPGDILELNASRERKIEDVQTKISNFVSTWAIGDMKYVLLDESDSLSPLAQRMLRGEIERYSDVVRFIFTCNYGNKIIPAIHSRCQGFNIQGLDLGEFTMRAANILVNEGVQLETEEDVEILNEFVAMTHPDLRKCINMLQQNVIDGKLIKPQEADSGAKDYILNMVALFKEGRYLEARKMIVSQAQPEEYEGIYRFFYENLDLWGNTDAKQNEALLIIRKGLVHHGMVGDVEINLAATLAELSILATQ